MTCIIGFKHSDGRVYVGADSAAMAGWEKTIVWPKVFGNNGLVIAYTTSFRMGQLLEHSFTPPARSEGLTIGYMVKEFVPAVREMFDANGFGKRGGELGDVGGAFIVAEGGELFAIESDYQVVHPINKMLAYGAGQAYAIGALHMVINVLPINQVDPSLAIKQSLKTASHYSAAVHGPFGIMSTGAVPS